MARAGKMFVIPPASPILKTFNLSILSVTKVYQGKIQESCVEELLIGLNKVQDFFGE